MTQEARRCDGCRFWSEMCAELAFETLKAVCLNPKSQCHGKFVSEHHSCPHWQNAPFGAIDAPGNEGAYENA